jgi:hypothetical protein
VILNQSHHYLFEKRPCQCGLHPLPPLPPRLLRLRSEYSIRSQKAARIWVATCIVQAANGCAVARHELHALPRKFNAEGGTELAPMSTTADASVAISYAFKRDTRSALPFRLVTRNNLERWVDVQWLSMFSGEAETLFPLPTFLQRTRTEPQDVATNVEL